MPFIQKELSGVWRNSVKYAVNEEGIRALRDAAQKLEDSIERITLAASSLDSAAEENDDTLGPHQATILRILENIREIEEAAAEPVESISEVLNDVAEAYQDVIDIDRFRVGGNSGLGTAIGGAAAASTGAEKNSLFEALGKVFSGTKESDGENQGTISAEAAELQRMGVNRVELSACDEKNRQEVLSAVKSMFAAHPELRGQLSEVICKPMRGGTYAAYGPTDYGSPFGGALHLNSSYFSDPALSDDLAEKSRKGWFVPNATPASIVTHELGHGLHLEMCAIDCGVKYGSVLSREDYKKIKKQYLGINTRRILSSRPVERSVWSLTAGTSVSSCQNTAARITARQLPKRLQRQRTALHPGRWPRQFTAVSYSVLMN